VEVPKPGMRVCCPDCGEETIVKTRQRVEGWRVVGEELVCALCGYVFGSAVDDSDDGRDADEVSRAAAFLGVEDVSAAPDARAVLGGDEERRFCKDCRYFFRHPFIRRCLLHDRPTEEMQDCPQFEPRSAVDSGGKERKEQAEESEAK